MSPSAFGQRQNQPRNGVPGTPSIYGQGGLPDRLAQVPDNPYTSQIGSDPGQDGLPGSPGSFWQGSVPDLGAAGGAPSLGGGYSLPPSQSQIPQGLQSYQATLPINQTPSGPAAGVMPAPSDPNASVSYAPTAQRVDPPWMQGRPAAGGGDNSASPASGASPGGMASSGRPQAGGGSGGGSSFTPPTNLTSSPREGSTPKPQAGAGSGSVPQSPQSPQPTTQGGNPQPQSGGRIQPPWMQAPAPVGPRSSGQQGGSMPNAPQSGPSRPGTLRQDAQNNLNRQNNLF